MINFIDRKEYHKYVRAENVLNQLHKLRNKVGEDKLCRCILCKGIGIDALLLEGICAASPYISLITTGFLDP